MLPRKKEMLERLYAGGPLPCGVGCGGTSEVVRVTTTPKGGGEVWLECLSCVQRVQLQVPPATAPEKGRVTKDLRADREPACPRHGRRMILVRRGRRLACPGCGVVYRE